MIQHDVLMAFIVFQAVFFLLDIYILTKLNRNFIRRGEYIFFCAFIILHCIYLLLNSAWSLQEFGILHLSTIGITLVCMGSYLSINSLSFIFFRFTIERIRFFPIRKKALQILFLLPLMLSGILILSSPWTHLVFYLDSDNTIIEGPAYLVMLISSSIYLLSVAVIALYNIFTVKTKIYRRSSAALFVSVLIIISFVFLDNQFPRVSILPVASFAVIIVIFINLQISDINSDSLTGLFNRRMADEYLQKQLSDISPEAPLYLYMCDMNDFKNINDTFGHMEGDEALQICGTVLRTVILQYNGFAARFGGDEFMMSWQPEEGTHPDPEDLIREVDRSLSELVAARKKPYVLSMCIGYTICAEKDESVLACIRKADEMLYTRKQNYHAEKEGSSEAAQAG